MALTQMQLIQSLGEAMAWFERELNCGVPPTELRHLVGRIGELYAALVTNGQMATEVNQKGYDVVSGTGERISVKTTAMMGSGGHVAFNPNSLALVDRVMVLRVNTEEMQVEVLFDGTSEQAGALMSHGGGKPAISLSKLTKTAKAPSTIPSVRSQRFGELIVRELESGTIEVWAGDVQVLPAKPALREMATALNVSIVNSQGNPLTTRQLGSLILKTLAALASDAGPGRA
jgi:hypothetical protein